MTANIWLWLDSIIQTDAAGAQSMLDCMVAVRGWAVDHAGEMSGFAFPWWRSLTPPFACYSRPDMEHFVDVLGSETDSRPQLRVVGYPMTVSQISANGLRFKVFDQPEMWVLAAQTQGAPG